jgi:hypothetical protein
MCFVEIAVFGLAFVIVFISMLARSEARMALLDSVEQY